MTTNPNHKIDRLIHTGMVALLVFTPLAYGSVQKWSVSLLEMVAFTLLGLTLLKYFLAWESPPQNIFGRSACLLSLLFAALILIQLVPLPDVILQHLSPASLSTFKLYDSSAAKPLHSISINPYATRQDLLLLLAYAAVFFVILANYRTQQQVTSLVNVLLLMGVFLVIFGFIQKATWNGRIFWLFPVDPYLAKNKSILGPFINRNHFAGYLGMVMPLALAILVYRAPRIKLLPGIPLAANFARIAGQTDISALTAFSLTALVLAAGICATLSRGGMISLTLSFLFFIWLVRKRRSLRAKAYLLNAFAVILLCIVVLASWEKLADRFDALKEGHVSRLNVWIDSVGIMRDYPAFGSGFGTFESAYMRYQTSDSEALYDHAHNDYVELLTDTGILGSLLAFGLALTVFTRIYRAWSRRRDLYVKCIGAGGMASLVAIGAHSCTDFNLHIPSNALLFTVVAALTTVTVLRVSGRTQTEIVAPAEVERSAAVARFRYGVMLIAVIFLLTFPARGGIADRYYASIDRILDNRETEELDVRPLLPESLPVYLKTLHAVETAHAIDTDRALYARTIADFNARFARWGASLASLQQPIPPGLPEQMQSRQAALHNLEQAIRLDPVNPDHHLALADLYENVLGDSVKADNERALAVQLYPHSTAIRYAAALQFLLAGKKGEALEQARLLAQHDDSYLLRDTTMREEILERRPEWYRNRLMNSGLYNAQEIVWRISRDPLVVQGITPNTAEAAAVLEMFMDSKGISSQEGY